MGNISTAINERITAWGLCICKSNAPVLIFPKGMDKNRGLIFMESRKSQ